MRLPYQGYIFDLYGTLTDIRTDQADPRLWQKTALYYTEHGAPYAGGELTSAYQRLCAEEQASSGEPLYEIELRRVFRALYTEKGLRPDARRVEETAVFFRLTSLRRLRRYAWVLPAFSALRAQGARLYLLSNAQSCFTVPELRALSLAEAFDAVVLSSDVGLKKPDRRIMEALLEREGLAAADCLMVGNDRLCDVGLADSVGMDALYLHTRTSGVYKDAPRAKYELLDGNFTKIHGFLGL